MAQLPPSHPSLSPVNQEAKVLCDFLATQHGEAIDLSEPLSLAVTNIISFICFNFSFKNEDPALKAIQNVNDGILEVLSKEVLLDIFPVLKVRMGPGPVGRPQQTLIVSPVLSSYRSLQTAFFSDYLNYSDLYLL